MSRAMTWWREMASLLRMYGQSVRDYRASMRVLYRQFPDLPRRQLRAAVKEQGSHGHD